MSRPWKTRKQREETIRQWAKRDFANHVAIIEESPDAYVHTVVHWHQPGHSNCAVTYLFTHISLCILGDLGNAVHNWYSPISPTRIAGCGIDYFYEKSGTTDRTSPEAEFDIDIARFDVDEFLREQRKDERGHGTRRRIFTVEEFADENGFDWWCDRHEFYHGIAEGPFIYGQTMDEEPLKNEDWYEHNWGRVVPLRSYLHLYGLQMAMKQLKKAGKA